MTLYSILDLQTGDIMHTGRNSETAQEAKEDVELFIRDGEDVAGLDDMSTDEVLELYEFRVIEHKEEMTYE